MSKWTVSFDDLGNQTKNHDFIKQFWIAGISEILPLVFLDSIPLSLWFTV